MSGPERSVPTAVVRVSLRQSRRVLQCSRRGVKVSHEIGHLALHDTLVAEADGLVDRWQDHCRVAVVLVGSVNEISKPRPRAQTLWSCQLSLDLQQRRIDLPELRCRQLSRKGTIARGVERNGRIFHPTNCR